MLRRSHAIYQAFGLRVQSELHLPELREAAPDAGGTDVVVSIGKAPRPTAGIELDKAEVCAGPALFWLQVDGLVRLLVRNGREMIVEPHPDAAQGDVLAYLLGSGIGALLHQRGSLPLHASAVEIDGRAVAFMAPSGGGKSTIAMHLDHLGHDVLCDDICALDTSGAVPRLWPGLRTLKLRRTSLAAIGHAPDGLEPVAAGVDKYRLPIAALADYRPYDLAATVMLDWGEAVDLTALPGGKGFSALMANTYRGWLVPPMGRQADHWRQCLSTFRAAPVWRLTRPRDLDGLSAASAAVVRALST